MKIVAYSDTHHCFCNHSKLNKLYALIKKEKPDIVIHLGDLFDLYMFSRFDRDLNLISPKQELERSKKHAVRMWEQIKKAAPKARLIQEKGNHFSRLTKQTMSRFPEIIEVVKDFEDQYFSFDGVECLKSERDYVEIEGVIYLHGFMSNPRAQRKHFNKNIVMGHIHKSNIWMEQSFKTNHELHWAVSVGSFVDIKAVPFNYTYSKFSQDKTSVAIIENGFPRLELL